jgi:hypothetical protein
LLLGVFKFCAQHFAFALCKHTSFGEFLAAKKPRSSAQHFLKIPKFLRAVGKVPRHENARF